jgi:hypothetical protein
LRNSIADWHPLPDLFSFQLGLPAPETLGVDEALRALGEAHRRLSGLNLNWAGSYRQHVALFLRQLGGLDGTRHN